MEGPNGDTELTTIAVSCWVCRRRLTDGKGLKPASAALGPSSNHRHQPRKKPQPPCGAAGAAAAPRHRGKSHRPSAAYLTSLRERLRRFYERCDGRLNARWTHGGAAPTGKPAAWFATLLGVRRGRSSPDCPRWRGDVRFNLQRAEPSPKIVESPSLDASTRRTLPCRVCRRRSRIEGQATPTPLHGNHSQRYFSLSSLSSPKRRTRTHGRAMAYAVILP